MATATDEIMAVIANKIMSTTMSSQELSVVFKRVFPHRNDNWDYFLILTGETSFCLKVNYTTMFDVRKTCVAMFGPIIYKKNNEMISLDTYVKRKRFLLLPGPPNWGGAEGGCLGLPTDIAHFILKY